MLDIDPEYPLTIRKFENETKFESSIGEKMFRTIWKSIHVIAIYEKKQDPEGNSLLPCELSHGKLFESLRRFALLSGREPSSLGKSTKLLGTMRK